MSVPGRWDTRGRSGKAAAPGAAAVKDEGGATVAGHGDAGEVQKDKLPNNHLPFGAAHSVSCLSSSSSSSL